MSLKLSTDQINYLNIGLMVFSAAVAFQFPFELFLFSYAVLGPLHYLTEISWLHDKHYYTQGKYDYLFLVAASIGVTVTFFASMGYLGGGPANGGAFIICLAFWSALAFVLLKGFVQRLLAIVGAALLAGIFNGYPPFGVVFGMFLPTLIHVFAFTGLFILIGALRGKSLSGILSLVVFIAVACGFIFFHPVHAGYAVADYVRNSYGFYDENGLGTSPFVSLNFFIVHNLKLGGFDPPAQPLHDRVMAINQFLYQNPAALALMSFVSFSYTYHYLNWFSKTSIIRWHEIPRARTIAILAVWVISLALYGYSYVLGFAWLFFLSLAHVILEFPLNHLTIINIGKELWKRVPLPRPENTKISN
jgi:hypothetical protein